MESTHGVPCGINADTTSSAVSGMRRAAMHRGSRHHRSSRRRAWRASGRPPAACQPPRARCATRVVKPLFPGEPSLQIEVGNLSRRRLGSEQYLPSVKADDLEQMVLSDADRKDNSATATLRAQPARKSRPLHLIPHTARQSNQLLIGHCPGITLESAPGKRQGSGIPVWKVPSSSVASAWEGGGSHLLQGVEVIEVEERGHGIGSPRSPPNAIGRVQRRVL